MILKEQVEQRAAERGISLAAAKKQLQRENRGQNNVPAIVPVVPVPKMSLDVPAILSPACPQDVPNVPALGDKAMSPDVPAIMSPVERGDGSCTMVPFVGLPGIPYSISGLPDHDEDGPLTFLEQFSLLVGMVEEWEKRIRALESENERLRADLDAAQAIPATPVVLPIARNHSTHAKGNIIYTDEPDYSALETGASI